MLYIRQHVFRLSQAAFGKVVGVSQATVSRWDRDEDQPRRGRQARIRELARERELPWDDRWFWEPPTVQSERDTSGAGVAA